MSFEVTIRSISAGDRENWERLFRAYIDFYEAQVADDTIAATFESLLSTNPGSFIGILAVDSSDTPVGFAHLLPHPSTWSRTGYVYLEDLYVDRDVRGRGIGEALIAATYAEADRLGATRTYWVTLENNVVARRLYDKVATKAPFVQYRRSATPNPPHLL